jgi:hypothetical protein
VRDRTEYDRRYNKKNAEKIRERDRLRMKAKRDAARGGEYKRPTEEEKRLKKNANSARWRERNPEQAKQLSKDSNAKHGKRWREENKDSIREKKDNLERLRSYRREYAAENRERTNGHKRKWAEMNQEKNLQLKYAYLKRRRREDPCFRAIFNMRTRLRELLSGRRIGPSNRLFGCSYEGMRLHLESQFEDWMTWDNYGEWHIDHVRPCASFDHSDPDQVKECWHFLNLRPLRGSENSRKGAKFIDEDGKIVDARRQRQGSANSHPKNQAVSVSEVASETVGT